MIITGVDHSHEDLLPWWIETTLNAMPMARIYVCDFGMSPAARGRINDRYPVEFSRPFNGTTAKKLGWFYKVEAVMTAPSKSGTWRVVNCVCH